MIFHFYFIWRGVISYKPRNINWQNYYERTLWVIKSTLFFKFFLITNLLFLPTLLEKLNNTFIFPPGITFSLLSFLLKPLRILISSVYCSIIIHHIIQYYRSFFFINKLHNVWRRYFEWKSQLLLFLLPLKNSTRFVSI